MGNQILKQSVGLDVSKDSVAACFSQREPDKPFRILSSRTFPSSANGFHQMEQWVGKQRCDGAALHLLMEATGVYYEELAYFLNSKGHRVSVLLPNKTCAFAKSLHYKSKTDKIDAQKLAQMSLERELPKWEPPSSNMLTIKRLCRERAELIEQKIAAGNQYHARLHSHAPEKSSLHRVKEHLKFLAKQIKSAEANILEALAQDPQIKERIDKVCTLNGVGIITAATVVSEANGFVLFKNKAQIVSYAGYDVIQNQSGTSINSPTKISKKGNARIRKALYFSAITAVRHEPVLKKIYDNVFEKSRIKMKAYVAVQRKILVLIYTLYKSNANFDPNFNSIKNNPHSQKK